MRKHHRTEQLCKAAGCVLLSASLACGLPTLALATPASEKQAEAQAAYAALASMQEELDRASNNLIDARAAKKQAQQKVKKAQKKIGSAQEKIETLQVHLGTRARTMYRSGTTSILDVLFSSASFQEFATMWDLLDQMNQKDAAMVQETKELKAEIEKQKTVLVEQQAEAEKQEQKALRAKDLAEQTVSEMTSTYNALSDEAKRLLKEEQEAQSRADAEAAQRAIEQAQAAEEQEQTQQEQTGSNGGSGGGNSQPDEGSSSGESSGGGNQSAVDRAYSMLGKPYQYGAGGMNTFDCSGLVGYAITGSTGHALGSTYTMMGFNRVTNPQPGDICVNDHHCGIYIGGGQMIHAPQTGDVVSISGVHGDMIYVRP